MLFLEEYIKNIYIKKIKLANKQINNKNKSAATTTKKP